MEAGGNSSHAARFLLVIVPHGGFVEPVVLHSMKKVMVFMGGELAGISGVVGGAEDFSSCQVTACLYQQWPLFCKRLSGTGKYHVVKRLYMFQLDLKMISSMFVFFSLSASHGKACSGNAVFTFSSRNLALMEQLG